MIFLQSLFNIESDLIYPILLVLSIPGTIILLYIIIIKDFDKPFISIAFFIKDYENIVYFSKARGSTTNKRKDAGGYCYLTRERLIFIPNKYGRFKLGIYEMFIPLKNIKSIKKVESFGRYKITTEDSKYFITWDNENKWIGFLSKFSNIEYIDIKVK